MDKYLIINCGSSSLKFSLYEVPGEVVVAKGYFERIGNEDSFWNISYQGKEFGDTVFLKDHGASVKVMLDELIKNKIIDSLDEIKGIGHRVLHGGEIYKNSVLIDDRVLADIVNMTNLGPLHHPGEIAGIRAMQEVVPKIPEVAVFDTAFHQTMPKSSYIYAVPYSWYRDYKVRKYGFHGTSHKYIMEVMQQKLEKSDINLIICHVGSGASISCIKNGKSYDTSMGLTPLDGLVMGTRSGKIDSSIIDFMIKNAGMSIDDVMNDLNKNSGLKGICGKNDFRDLSKMVSEGREEAILAYEIFVNSIVDYIAKYYFMLDGNVDAIVFTAGILENNTKIRADIIDKISNVMQIFTFDSVNDSIGYGKRLKEGIITTEESKIPVYVIPTNEELMILRDTCEIVKETL